MAAGPPPGPTRPGFWRSPLRGPWLTSVFGLILLFGVTILFVTGLLSYAAYNPDLAPVNDQTLDKGWLGFHLFSWPTSPTWPYRLTQGVHVTLGVVLVPALLAKLWSVIPKLFEWPPNDVLQNIFRRVGGGPVPMARAAAMMNAAIYDAESSYQLKWKGKITSEPSSRRAPSSVTSTPPRARRN